MPGVRCAGEKEIRENLDFKNSLRWTQSCPRTGGVLYAEVSIAQEANAGLSAGLWRNLKLSTYGITYRHPIFGINCVDCRQIPRPAFAVQDDIGEKKGATFS